MYYRTTSAPRARWPQAARRTPQERQHARRDGCSRASCVATNDALPDARARTGADSLPGAGRPAGRTCSTCTCRSASGCARTARSTASRSTRSARAPYFKKPARGDADGRRPGLRLRVACTWAAARPRSCSTSCARRIDLARELFSIKEVSSETNPNHLVPEFVEPLERSRAALLAWACSRFDDELLKQMDRYDKYGSACEILERLQSIDGRVPLAQRGHDLQLPEPDRGDAAPRHRDAEGVGLQPDDVLPAHGVAGGRASRSSAPWARSTTRARPRYYEHLRAGSRTPSSPRARGRSRARAAA